jgi:ankyrin repeat protein
MISGKANLKGTERGAANEGVGKQIVGAITPVIMCSAAGQGMLEELTQMVADGVSVNVCDYDKRSALHLAVSEGHLHCAEFLISKGALQLKLCSPLFCHHAILSRASTRDVVSDRAGLRRLACVVQAPT